MLERALPRDACIYPTPMGMPLFFGRQCVFRYEAVTGLPFNTVELNCSLLFPYSQGPYDVVVLPGGNLGAQNLSEVKTAQPRLSEGLLKEVLQLLLCSVVLGCSWGIAVAAAETAEGS